MTAFTGARLDRASDARRRDPAWLAEQREHPGARALLAGDEGVVMDGDRLARAPLGRALRADVAGADAGSSAVAAGTARAAAADSATGAATAEPLLLGIDAVGPLFVVDVDAPATVGDTPPPLIAAGGARGSGARRPPPADGPRPVPLREAVAVLPQDEGGLVAYVAALCNWHRRHRFCAACGSPSTLGEGGLIRACTRCRTGHHPRTDPVVIMLVTGGDRVMLGRAPSWPERRYSALAGFVEPGETLEEAVAREVAEESGVEVDTPRYVASQPWPFPSSLMIGFEAPHRSGEPRPREADVQDVRWFTRAEIAGAAAADSDGWGAPKPGEPLLLPPRLAIARQLIEAWLTRGAH